MEEEREREGARELKEPVDELRTAVCHRLTRRLPFLSSNIPPSSTHALSTTTYSAFRTSPDNPRTLTDIYLAPLWSIGLYSPLQAPSILGWCVSRPASMQASSPSHSLAARVTRGLATYEFLSLPQPRRHFQTARSLGLWFGIQKRFLSSAL